VSSEKASAQIIDSYGCEVDAHFIETPIYSRVMEQERVYVHQEMSAFKFPKDSNLIFRCKISFCDANSSSCLEAIPPKCSEQSGRGAGKTELAEPKPRTRRQSPEFLLTVPVETRTLNVIETEAIKPSSPVRYCEFRN